MDGAAHCSSRTPPRESIVKWEWGGEFNKKIKTFFVTKLVISVFNDVT